jgi:hypothetical protein
MKITFTNQIKITYLGDLKQELIEISCTHAEHAEWLKRMNAKLGESK